MGPFCDMWTKNTPHRSFKHTHLPCFPLQTPDCVRLLPVCPAARSQRLWSWTRPRTSRFTYSPQPANPCPTLTEFSGGTHGHSLVSFMSCPVTDTLIQPAGPCALWSSWRSLSTAATGPTRWPPPLEPTWPRSWRNIPRCLLTMQALMCRCLESVCSFRRRQEPLKHHPKPSNVRAALLSAITDRLWLNTECIFYRSLFCRRLQRMN